MGDQFPKVMRTLEEVAARYTAVERQEERDREELRRRIHRAFTPEQRAVVADILQIIFDSRAISQRAIDQTITMFRE